MKPWILWLGVIIAFLLLITAWTTFIVLSQKYAPQRVPLEESHFHATSGRDV